MASSSSVLPVFVLDDLGTDSMHSSQIYTPSGPAISLLHLACVLLQKEHLTLVMYSSCHSYLLPISIQHKVSYKGIAIPSTICDDHLSIRPYSLASSAVMKLSLSVSARSLLAAGQYSPQGCCSALFGL